MELKEKLEELLNEDVREVNEYFCNGEFLDDCNNYFEKNAPVEVLDYLTDAFYTIDIDYRDTEEFADAVKGALLKALQMVTPKTVYCPIKGDQITGIDCLVVCDVVDRLLKPTVIPKDIVWKEEMREICKACKYHDDIK